MKPLRFLLIIVCLLSVSSLKAQIFSFQLTSTSIVNTTAQSPAHWYLEIDNNVGVDTSLRWKADLSAIPAGWTINLDDQNNNYVNVQTGDSADFILFGSPTFPQKIIVGAVTNNIAATASAFFDIYNPADTSSHVIIEYEFVITPVTGTVSVEADPEVIQVHENAVFFSFPEPTPFSMVSVTGQSVYTGTIEKGSVNVSWLQHGIYFVYFFADNMLRVKKIAF